MDPTHPVSGPSLAEWARAQAPFMSVVSVSEPEPLLDAHNLIAVTGDPEAARKLLLDWERIENAGGAVGLVALARVETARDQTDAVDPENVMGHASKRVALGAVPGAVVGAAFMLAVAAVLGFGSAGLIGAALGGAAFGAVAGSVSSFVKGTGWSDAYMQSFIDADATEVVIASIHSDSGDSIAEAISSAATHDVTLYRLSRDARPVLVDMP